MLGKFFNLIVALLLFGVLFTAIDDSSVVWAGKEEAGYIGIADITGPQSGGIFTDFIFSFELLSLLLLAALIGALYIAKKEAK